MTLSLETKDLTSRPPEIVRPITDDGLVGYNKSGHLIHCKVEGDYSIFRGIYDVRLLTCIICDHGWQEDGPSMGDQMKWDLTKEYVHLSCYVRHEGLCERGDFYSAIVNARLRFSGLVPIPNRYWAPPDEWAKKPWYQAELLDYPAKLIIGARKRVISIELKAQGGRVFDWAPAAEEAFKDENVTKSFAANEVLLHAYGTQKMREYVKKLADISGFNKPLNEGVT